MERLKSQNTHTHTHTDLEYTPTPSNFTVMIKSQALFIFPCLSYCNSFLPPTSFSSFWHLQLHLSLQQHTLDYCLINTSFISQSLLTFWSKHSPFPSPSVGENAPTASRSRGLNENHRAPTDFALPRILSQVLVVLSTLCNWKSVCHIAQTLIRIKTFSLKFSSMLSYPGGVLGPPSYM